MTWFQEMSYFGMPEHLPFRILIKSIQLVCRTLAILYVSLVNRKYRSRYGYRVCCILFDTVREHIVQTHPTGHQVLSMFQS